MSQARLYYTKKSRKVYTCTGCWKEIPVGSPVITFAVGFRARDQRRHDTPECRPSRAARESSALATVYAAMDDVDLSTCQTLGDLEEAVQAVADACREVADEYESNEMYEINEMLQERAEMLNSAADELESWNDSLDDEPDEDTDCEECDGTGEVEVEVDGSDEPNVEDCEECDGTGKVDAGDAHDEWLEQAREAAQEAIDSVELP